MLAQMIASELADLLVGEAAVAGTDPAPRTESFSSWARLDLAVEMPVLDGAMA